MNGSAKPRGFAALSPERRAEIARKGGQSAHQQGVANKFTSETGRYAGTLGGITVSKDREHMREIGRKGGCKTREKMAGEIPPLLEPSDFQP